ncbi:Cdc37 protein [Thalassiosira pseudonana CCMP1335]|uniref:Hsp90 chaperone protein kinase-targeting subunit n=1 Tax=Thalassiosira pseudonana TaxID=35128 RepID=B8C4C6_THAPS|nr:Cdc37 protein [Thalassiosira pseudonana CCMP1335]EED91303.1 Cdc37 protein [Thalassiosira pseudonana CCMP1335]
MSKPFDYSKWDNIELSDDEDDVHPNIDKESWFRMKHRSRVEREEREEADKKKIHEEMAKANLRIKEIKKILSKSTNTNEDSDSDDDLEDLDGLRAELQSLEQSNSDHQDKLDAYEKNKKWNVDNMSTVAASNAAIAKFQQPQPEPEATNSVSVSMLSYHEFTEKYADVVEEFMAIESLDRSKEFLIQKGDILLQENASNYLLLASLEDEMNGFHEKMKLVARQSQIISNIAELAKSLQRHPGNVIVPFFQRLDNKELYDGFMDGVNQFIKRIEVRAVEKRKEIDEERAREAKEHGAASEDAVDISTIPLEERLGPGGLDPMEVFESLPESMQLAFESREKEQLEAALGAMTPDEASYHMQRCIDSGLWNA